jgi:hypothetical protein
MYAPSGPWSRVSKFKDEYLAMLSRLLNAHGELTLEPSE